MNAWFVYLILKLDLLGNTALFLGLCFGVVLIFLIYCYTDEYWGEDKKDTECVEAKCVRRWIATCCILFVFVNIFYIAIPNTKQACVIYLLPKMANNENLQKIPNHIAELMGKKLEQWAEETKGVSSLIETAKGEKETK